MDRVEVWGVGFGVQGFRESFIDVSGCGIVQWVVG